MSAMLLCALSLASGAEPPKEDVVKAQYEKLQGMWRFVSIELDGKAVAPPLAAPGFDLVVTGTKFAVGKAEGEVVLNAAANPPAIDLRYAKPDEGTVVGIYKFDGDTLTLCLKRGKGEAQDRPTEFVSRGTTDIEIRVYKFEQPKK